MSKLKEQDGVPYDLIRADGRLERHCKHGVGHTVGHRKGYLEPYDDVHGCCFTNGVGSPHCCAEFERMEMRESRPTQNGGSDAP